MSLLPDRLKELRRRNKMSRKQLADKARLVDNDNAGISLRQIARLEDNGRGSAEVRERTLLVLANALGVHPGVLTGEFPLPPQQQSSAEADRVSITALMTSETRLQYGLIKRRYGVSPTAIINMAPLFFTLLAEGSFKWRREKLSEFEKAADQVREVQRNAEYLSFVNAIYRAEEAASDEQKSIDAIDLFGDHVSEDVFNLGGDPSQSNPFADYLRMLASKIDKEELIAIEPNIESSPLLKGFPGYSVCDAELDAISAHSVVAALSLRWGYVRLSEIPSELFEPGQEAERVKWIEERAPDNVKELASIEINI